MAKKCQEMVERGLKMVRICQIKNIREMVRNCQDMVKKWQANGQEMVRKWIGVVPRWSNIPRRSKIFRALEVIHSVYVRPERRLTMLPCLWFDIVLPVVFFSRFPQIFPHSQVDRLFQTGHCAISHSLTEHWFKTWHNFTPGIILHFA